MRGIRLGVRTLAVGVVFALAACREVPPPQQAAVSSELSRHDRLLLAAAAVALPPPGVTPADLPEPAAMGAQLVGKYCAQCHEVPSPAMHSATDWPSVVRRMWLRMDLLPPDLGVQVPTAAERSAMFEYITRYALQVSGASLPAGPGRATFAEVCSRCHALPDPRMHSRQDWPTVFQRMERNMERMNVKPLTKSQTTDILLYLQGVGSRR